MLGAPVLKDLGTMDPQILFLEKLIIFLEIWANQKNSSLMVSLGILFLIISTYMYVQDYNQNL